MSRLPISVLIPTMNRPNTLKATLESYLNSEFIPDQIIVVDQSENEQVACEVKCLVKSYITTDAVYIHQNPSLTKARNTAMLSAKNDLVVMSDDDVIVYPDTLLNVYQLMNDGDITMISGIDDNMKKSHSWLGYLFGTKSFPHRHIGHVTASMLGRFPDNMQVITETMWAMGYFFVIRKTLVEKWNISWDEKLPGYAYAEDLDFSFSYYKSAKKEGKKCIISPDVHVKHISSVEYRVPSRKSTFMYVLNREYLRNKHNPGVISQIATAWCNFWIYIDRVVKRNKPGDMWDAIRYLRKHKAEVRNGLFPY